MKFFGRLGVTALSVLLLTPSAFAQYGSDYTTMPAIVQNMVVLSNSTGTGDYYESQVNYEIYNPNDTSGNWHAYRQADDDDGYSGNDTWQEITDNYQNQGSTGTAVAGAPWYTQTLQFDNAGGVSHNPNGNLLVANFGNDYTGFELYTVNTNGSGNAWSSVWSSQCEAGGNYGEESGPTYDSSLSNRMGGLSVSPFNDKVACVSNDTGDLWVLDYYGGGTAAGTGVAQWGQDPVKDAGVWAGNPRCTGNNSTNDLSVGGSGVTQGSTWLDNNTIAVFNTYAKIVTVNVAGVEGGLNQAETTTGDRTDQSQPNMVPTEMNDWTIEVEVAVNVNESQYTDIEYNPAVDPYHVYCSETQKNTYDGWLYRVEYDPETGEFGDTESWDLPDVGNATEPREIAFDSEGNLWISGYRYPSKEIGDACVVITDLANNFGDDSSVSVSLEGEYYGGYSGMDVASGLDVLYDINGDGSVNASDLNLLLINYNDDVHMDPTTGYVVDLNNDGCVNASDLNLLLIDYNDSYISSDLVIARAFGISSVPEPSTLLMLIVSVACASISAFFRRRNSNV